MAATTYDCVRGFCGQTSTVSELVPSSTFFSRVASETSDVSARYSTRGRRMLTGYDDDLLRPENDQSASRNFYLRKRHSGCPSLGWRFFASLWRRVCLPKKSVNFRKILEHHFTYRSVEFPPYLQSERGRISIRRGLEVSLF